MALNFVDELPGGTRRRGRWSAVREELRANPGVWAEISRYSGRSNRRAANDGVSLAGRYPDIQMATRTVGDETVLYARAVAR